MNPNTNVKYAFHANFQVPYSGLGYDTAAFFDDGRKIGSVSYFQRNVSTRRRLCLNFFAN